MSAADDLKRRLAAKLAAAKEQTPPGSPPGGKPRRPKREPTPEEIAQVTRQMCQIAAKLIRGQIDGGELTDAGLTGGEMARVGMETLVRAMDQKPAELLTFLGTAPIDQLETMLDSLAAAFKITQSLGTTVYAIRKLRKAGYVMPQEVIDAFREELDPIDEEARTILKEQKPHLYEEKPELKPKTGPAKRRSAKRKRESDQWGPPFCGSEKDRAIQSPADTTKRYTTRSPEWRWHCDRQPGHTGPCGVDLAGYWDLDKPLVVEWNADGWVGPSPEELARRLDDEAKEA